jgi:hypothetical protein
MPKGELPYVAQAFKLAASLLKKAARSREVSGKNEFGPV